MTTALKVRSYGQQQFLPLFGRPFLPKHGSPAVLAPSQCRKEAARSAMMSVIAAGTRGGRCSIGYPLKRW